MKRLAALILSLALCFALCMPAYGLYFVPETNGESLADTAGIFNDSEKQGLQEKIDLIESEYAYDVVIHVVDEEVAVDEIQNYAQEFCEANNYASGETEIGIAFIYFWELGDVCCIAEIGAGESVLTDEQIDTVSNIVYDELTNSNYYSAFEQSLNEVYSYLSTSPQAEALKITEEETDFELPSYYNPMVNRDPGLQEARGESVVDDADLLTSFEEQSLAEKINEIIEKYSYDVVIHTTPSAGSKDVMEYVDDFYDYGGYGYGEDADGMAFALIMDTRDYWTSTCGIGIDIFNDNVIEYLGDTIVNDLSNGNYYAAFHTYLEEVEQYLDEYENDIIGDNYYDTSEHSSNPKVKDILTKEFGFLMLSVVIAGFAIFIMRKQMNTAVAKKEANAYIKNGSVNIGYQRDTFLYDTVTKRAKPKNNGGSGGSRPSGGGGFSGGSRTHTSSSGRSHGGGGGKF